MTTTYVTGTRYPNAALEGFIPNYVDTLLGQGESLLTTTKMGVDRLIIQYCDQPQLPLKVLKFSPPHHQPVQPTSPTIQLQQMCSPTWRRLRYVVEVSDKIRFFHARLPTKPAQEMTTVEAFERVSGALARWSAVHSAPGSRAIHDPDDFSTTLSCPDCWHSSLVCLHPSD